MRCAMCEMMGLGVRRWMTLEPSRGRLLFMDKEGGRAIAFIELSQCSTVYEATAVRRRAVAERVLGLERVGEPQRLQDAIGSFFKRKSGSAETVAQLREYWDQLDSDRDGELELHEVEAFL